jgi:hypothetical protein
MKKKTNMTYTHTHSSEKLIQCVTKKKKNEMNMRAHVERRSKEKEGKEYE